jgi:hypothetical protein
VVRPDHRQNSPASNHVFHGGKKPLALRQTVLAIKPGPEKNICFIGGLGNGRQAIYTVRIGRDKVYYPQTPWLVSKRAQLFAVYNHFFSQNLV